MNTLKWTRHLGVILGACALSACSGGRDGSSDRAHRDPAGQVVASTSSNLQWKRHAAFEADLAAALELPTAEVCREFGTDPCISKVHMVPLGGHEPFETGMFASSPEPLTTTPTVVDRVMLIACGNRVDLDRAAGGEAVVFKHFSLEGAAPAPGSAEATALITDLYRRLLARNPSDAEIEAVSELARSADGTPAPAAQFARLACFTIGSSAEFLFF